jgi:hypothetical protein
VSERDGRHGIQQNFKRGTLDPEESRCFGRGCDLEFCS